MTVLDDLLEGVREDLAARQARTDLGTLQQLAAERRSPLPAESILREGDTVKVIAEVKRLQPVQGRAGRRSPTRPRWPRTTRPAAPA